jgi:hypothetical protein
MMTNPKKASMASTTEAMDSRDGSHSDAILFHIGEIVVFIVLILPLLLMMSWGTRFW